MPYLAPLAADQQATFLVVALPQKTLRKLVGALGTAPSGTRLDSLHVWDLAWSLTDYYATDAEVAASVDKALRKELGPAPLANAVTAEGGAAAVTDLVMRSKDPARDLAWAILSSGADAGARAAELVQTIVAEFDDADERAKEREAETPPPAEPLAPPVEHTAVKEAAKARSARDRALKRAGLMKERVTELEEGLATARRELRAAEEARELVEAEQRRMAEERATLRAQVRTGDAAMVARLEAELETVRRQLGDVETELDEARDSEAALGARIRVLEGERSRPAGETAPHAERPAADATWNLPIFSDEFYESIRRWDRKIVRIAFEKIVRLSEDWRHPSLRAIPLEGIPGYYRIRIASDVRLIYRPLDGGRVEILSLIDREDLQRYVRQAKSRRGA